MKEIYVTKPIKNRHTKDNSYTKNSNRYILHLDKADAATKVHGLFKNHHKQRSNAVPKKGRCMHDSKSTTPERGGGGGGISPRRQRLSVITPSEWQSMSSGWKSLRWRKKTLLQYPPIVNVFSVLPNRWTAQISASLVRIVYAIMLMKLHSLTKTRRRHGLSIMLDCSMLSFSGQNDELPEVSPTVAVQMRRLFGIGPQDKDARVKPDSKVHGANMGYTSVLSVPDGPHVGPMNHAIRG